MFFLGFGVARAVRRALVPRRRYYRRSCSRNNTPSSPVEIIGMYVGLVFLLIILANLGNSHTYPARYTNNPSGWYTGADGNYYPDGFPAERTLPKPQPAATETAVATPAPAVHADATNWLLLAAIGGGTVLVLAALLWPYGRRDQVDIVGGPTPLGPLATRRRPPPPPTAPWRPYDQPFEL